MSAQIKKKLWVVYTIDLHYNVTGLGETEDEAKLAVWNEIKSTDNSGSGLSSAMKKSLASFFESCAWRSYHLAPGEAKSE
jgi:hypothetical protein